MAWKDRNLRELNSLYMYASRKTDKAKENHVSDYFYRWVRIKRRILDEIRDRQDRVHLGRFSEYE